MSSSQTSNLQRSLAIVSKTSDSLRYSLKIEDQQVVDPSSIAVDPFCPSPRLTHDAVETPIHHAISKEIQVYFAPFRPSADSGALPAASLP
jgi:hypothetical protein